MKRRTWDEEYHEKRLKKKHFYYRLERRALAVLEAILVYKGNKIGCALDVGTADGIMVSIIKKNLTVNSCIGMDTSLELLKSIKDPYIKTVQADAAHLPFKSNSFDVLIAAAVIEHISDYGKALNDFKRTLKEGGLCIITTPTPAWDKLSKKLNYESRILDVHEKLFSIQEVKELLRANGFKVLKGEKFMITPFGFPFERAFEKLLNLIGLGFLMCNQIVVGQKIG